MSRRTSEDIFRQKIPAPVGHESVFYRGMFGGGDFFPVFKIDRGDCESDTPPAVQYNTASVSGCTWQRTTVEKYEGESSYMITKASGAAAHVYLMSGEGLHGFIPGAQYRLSCVVKVKEEYAQMVELFARSDEGQAYMPDSFPKPIRGLGHHWQNLVILWEIPTGTENVEIGIRVLAEFPIGERIYFDNFQLEMVSRLESGHFRGGSVYNEIELARYTAEYFAAALTVVGSRGAQLDNSINRYVSLTRLSGESDLDYLDRFKALVFVRSNPRRLSKHALIDSLSYFVERRRVEITERFEEAAARFYVRFLTFETEFVAVPDTAAFTGNTDRRTGATKAEQQRYMGNSYLEGLGNQRRETHPQVDEILERIKTVGVEARRVDVLRRTKKFKGAVLYKFTT